MNFWVFSILSHIIKFLAIVFINKLFGLQSSKEQKLFGILILFAILSLFDFR